MKDFSIAHGAASGISKSNDSSFGEFPCELGNQTSAPAFSRKRGRMAKVRVFQFKVFDMSGKEDAALSGRYATTATVAILGGKALPDTYIYVDESELENGMTRPGFKPLL